MPSIIVIRFPLSADHIWTLPSNEPEHECVLKSPYLAFMKTKELKHKSKVSANTFSNFKN